jgi:hypothetical protein
MRSAGSGPLHPISGSRSTAQASTNSSLETREARFIESMFMTLLYLPSGTKM